MEIRFLTIVLDGMPWITRHWPEFEKLNHPWKWWVVEGAASRTTKTDCVEPMAPRLSNDGTTQYLDSLAAYDPRVLLWRKELWRGKTVMVNEPLKSLFEPCLLFEIDSDELWTAEQINKIVEMFESDPSKNCARFFCDFRVGRKWRITSRGGYGNHRQYEWHRVWRAQQGTRFKSHEPPVLERFREVPFTQEETEKIGLVFRHEAYSVESQVKAKIEFYSSDNAIKRALFLGALEKWTALQRSPESKVKLKNYMPWVEENVIAERFE